ncbi:hypothetical protein ROBYS_43320 [Roseobacter sp. OBYS 0001]|nr:hypothetical protein ROBYS_43320 [Roseobacter sp. OBYS 0001]
MALAFDQKAKHIDHTSGGRPETPSGPGDAPMPDLTTNESNKVDEVMNKLKPGVYR